MKTLFELTNVEKGKILGSLFRDELPLMIDCLKSRCTELLEREIDTRKSWKNTFFSADLWFSVMKDLSKQLDKFAIDMIKSPNVFADQAFFEYRAMVSVHLLLELAYKEGTNSKLAMAIKLLFD